MIQNNENIVEQKKLPNFLIERQYHIKSIQLMYSQILSKYVSLYQKFIQNNKDDKQMEDQLNNYNEKLVQILINLETYNKDIESKIEKLTQDNQNVNVVITYQGSQKLNEQDETISQIKNELLFYQERLKHLHIQIRYNRTLRYIYLSILIFLLLINVYVMYYW
jgi:maltodextrin utilization protein YvdJ